MRNKKIKSKLVATIFVGMLTIATFLVAIPASVAAEEFDTWIYLFPTPNPVGINQQVVLQFFMPDVPPRQFPLDRPRYGYWEGITIDVERPNGETETLTGLKSGEAGAGFTYYTPSMVGTYTFKANFPGQTIEVGPQAGDYYRPSSSPEVALTVQNEQIEPWPASPDPSEYWETPIYAENREWSKFAGNWLNGDSYTLQGNGYNPHTIAPNTSHILWTKQEMFGGIAAAELESYPWYSGRRPNEKFTPPLIISGRLFYNHNGFGQYGEAQESGFTCVDLYTGETIWSKDIQDQLSIGQVFYFYSVAQSGVFGYLWSLSSSTWAMYEAFTGDRILTIENVSSGTNVFGENGEIINYRIRNGMITKWNSTKVLLTGMRVIGIAIDWTPTSGEYDWADGIEWSVPIPDTPGTPSIAKIEDVIYARTGDLYIAYDKNDGSELWRSTLQRSFVPSRSPQMSAISGDILVEYYHNTLQWYGYDLTTGEEIWGPTVPYDNPLAMFNRDMNIVDCRFLTTGYDGIVHAHDLGTGELDWSWSTGSSGLETPYGGWPLHGSYTNFKIADGKVFVINSEHTPGPTLYRGGKVYAIDLETGEEVWSVSGNQAEAASMAIAYGCLVYLNGYDGKLYCFGKGPTALSVSMPQTEIAKGSMVTITGSIFDISAGTELNEQASRFPNGVPAVSDESMSDWMEYVYMQQPRPEDITGVPVKLAYQLPDGTWKDIDQVTSDAYGNFGFSWAPPDEGTYLVKAFFLGSESYWGSSDTAYLTVGPAGATGEEIAADAAQRTINMLPQYPDVPTAEEIAAESASRTIAMLPQYPDVPTSEEIAADSAQRTINMLPQYPTYLTIDLVIIVLVVVAIIIGLYIIIRKK